MVDTEICYLQGSRACPCLQALLEDDSFILPWEFPDLKKITTCEVMAPSMGNLYPSAYQHEDTQAQLPQPVTGKPTGCASSGILLWVS